MRKILLYFYAIFLFGVVVQAQTIDSLQQALNSQKGAARIKTLGELSYQLMYDQPSEAIAYGSRAVKEALGQPDSLLMAQAYNDLSLPYLVTGNFDSVIILNTHAYRIRMKAGKAALAAANLAKIGQAYYELGNYKQSIIEQAKACYIYEKLGDTARLVQMSNNMGALFEKYKANIEAMKWYTQARELAEAIGDERGEALAKINQSILYRKAGDFRKAELLMLAVKPFMESKGFVNERAKYYESFGVLCRATKRPDEGKDYYEKALEAYLEQGDEPGLANVYRNLGLCYVDLKQSKKALDFFEQALFFARKNNIQDQVQKILFDLYEWHKYNGNASKALSYLEAHKACSDSVYNTQTTQSIQEYSAKYQLERHKATTLQKQKELLEAQVAIKKRNILLMWSIGITLLLALILVIYRWYYTQKRQAIIHQNELAMNEERVRISRDLHDNLGSELTWLASEMDLRAYAETNFIQRERLNELAEKMRGAMRSLRDTIWAIHQNQSTLEQLLGRLSENTRAVLEVGKIQLNLPENIPTITLSPAQTLHVYRIMKEAITNAIKYADCNHILIEAKVNEETLHLILRDNGKGFKLEEHYASGYGLRNMESRANENGMQLVINTSPGYGTELKLYMPIITQMQNLV